VAQIPGGERKGNKRKKEKRGGKGSITSFNIGGEKKDNQALFNFHLR